PLFPEVRSEPNSAKGPHRPCRVAITLARWQRESPRIAIVMCHPSRRTVESFCRQSSRLGQFCDEVDQGFRTLSEPDEVGQPVIHGQVDIERVVGTPWWPWLVVPDALQVRRSSARPRRRDRQVATKIDEERGERRILPRVMTPPQPHVGGGDGVVTRWKLDREPVPQSAV